MLSREACDVLAFIEDNDMKGLFRDKERYGAVLEENRLRGAGEPEPSGEWLQGTLAEKKLLPEGTVVWRLRPEEGPVCGTRVIYFHGGGFVLPCGEPQWRFATQITKEASAEVDVVLYPLAPNADCIEACRAVESAYAALVAEEPEKIVLIGDSAGGYFAIACAQLALVSGIRMPDRVIVLSPALDLFDAFEGREERDDIDPLISLAGLRDVVNSGWAPVGKYRGAFPPDVFAGPMEGLPPTSIYVGGREVLLIDSVEFARLLAGKAESVNLHVEREMWHTYPLFMEMPEAKAAIGQIVSSITSLAERGDGL